MTQLLTVRRVLLGAISGAALATGLACTAIAGIETIPLVDASPLLLSSEGGSSSTVSMTADAAPGSEFFGTWDFSGVQAGNCDGMAAPGILSGTVTFAPQDGGAIAGVFDISDTMAQTTGTISCTLYWGVTSTGLRLVPGEECQEDNGDVLVFSSGSTTLNGHGAIQTTFADTIAASDCSLTGTIDGRLAP